MEAGDLLEEHALRIGRQVLRDNAHQLFPQLRERLWKHRGPTSMERRLGRRLSWWMLNKHEVAPAGGA